MKRSLFALSLGTLALGIAEFVMMAILPYVATDLNISIATAGHLISAYALGVCAGAPALVLTRKFQLKNTLLWLVALIVIGNSMAAISPNYATMMIARFISGLPHGAYFGVGSIIASKLAKEGKSTEAISIMVAGMTIANLLGVPLGTSLSSLLSWRWVFGIVGIGGLAVLFYIWRWVPQVEKLPNTGFKGQFRFLKSGAPWLIIAGTMFGNGGIFCWYSYIHPLLTDVARISRSQHHAIDDTGRPRHGLRKPRGWKVIKPFLSGTGCCTHSGMCSIASSFYFLLGIIPYTHGAAYVPLYHVSIRRIKSTTVSCHTLLTRRRIIGSSQCTSGIQFRECTRSFLRGSASRTRFRIYLSGHHRGAYHFLRIFGSLLIPPPI